MCVYIYIQQEMEQLAGFLLGAIFIHQCVGVFLEGRESLILLLLNILHISLVPKWFSSQLAILSQAKKKSILL